MKISVIIPVYNTGNYLRKCVKSICDQTHKELQIILINDGSTDESLEVMKELAEQDERICIVDIEHAGVSTARNAGLEIADGDFISFIDSDDWLDINTYQRCMELVEQNNVDIVYFEWTEEYSDGSNSIKGYDGNNKLILEGDEIFVEYYKQNINMRISSGVLARKLLRDIWFDVARESGEDMLFGFYALCNAKRVAYVNEPFYHRYNRVGSLSNRKEFFPEDFGQATCSDDMLEYIKKHNKRFLQEAYVKCFNCYMVILNSLVYYRAEEEHREIYDKIIARLEQLLRDIENPIKTLPMRFYISYHLHRISSPLYFIVMKVYYKYIKKERDTKRQR